MTTTSIPGTTVAERIRTAFPGAVIEASEASVTVRGEDIADVARFLRDDPELDCKYLNCLTAVDWLDHFDVVYVLSSLAKNHTLVLEARVPHDEPALPSVYGVWLGANLQEREVYDLMGISFIGHPTLKRLFLWEGFPGHPLRKDFLALPGGYKPGLQRFPFEFPEGQRAYEGLSGEEPKAPPVPRLAPPIPGQTEARGIAGGQLAVRGGGARATRAPGGVEPLPPENVGGAGISDTTSSTGGRTPLSGEDSKAQPEGGSGSAGQPERPEERT
ncbi:MAG TPA: NADH-quinone oxidoreductase subunit C [Dehalococcoidia bacterium]|nr:NADH-quinone oxidoreductase subunit C [Dehalococcoidia bacterium]